MEIALVAAEAYHLQTDILGVPYWLPFMYACASLAVGNLGRSLMYSSTREGMKEHDFSSWALDALLVHNNNLALTSNNSGKPTVEPIFYSTACLHGNTRDAGPGI